MHVARRRLTDVVAAATVTLIDAPGGFGKTALAVEVAEQLGVARVSTVVRRETSDAAAVVGALRRSLLAAGLSDLAGSLGEVATDPSASVDDLLLALGQRDEPLVVVIDEAHRLDGEARALVVGLAAGVPPAHRLLVLGRDLPAAAWPVDGVRIDAAALRFTDAEVAAVLGVDVAPAAAARVARATEGWPAAVAVAAGTSGVDGIVAAPDRPGGALAALLDHLLAGCDEETIAEFAALVRLPLLDAEIAACVGPDTWARARAVGLPIVATERGWFDLLDPVRELLAPRGVLSVDVARAAASRYAARGELAVACGLLAGLSDHEGLAALLGGRHWRDLEALDLAELQGLLRAVEPSPSSAPAFLAAARVAEAVGAHAQRAELLDVAASAATGGLADEVRAEQAIDLAFNGESDAAEAAAAVVTGQPGVGDLAARGRALVAVGRARAFRRAATSFVDAEAPLVEAASIFATLGEPEWRAGALLVLGYSVHYATGDLDRAVDRLGDGLRALAYADRRRATFATYFAQVLGAAGRLDEAEATLREAEEIGRLLGDHRVRAFAAWTGAQLAAQRLDHGRTVELLLEVERHPGDWFVHPTGAEFLADAASALAHVADEAGARAYLERSEARAEALGHPEIAEPARAYFEARFGEAARADTLLAALPDSPQVPPRERWRILLYRALAAQRRGHPDAAAFADRAFAAAAIMGYPDLPFLVEAEVAGQVATSNARPAPRREIRLLGEFTVSADGVALDVAPGRTSDLVKVLALADGPMATEVVLDALWPDTDPATGRSRLRNLLNRLRGMVGDLVERDGDALTLAAGVAVDARDFDADATAALAAAGADRLGLARAALARYGGELLPADRYAEWAAAPRERLRRRHLDVLDVLAADAEARGDVDEAIRHLEEGIAAEPLDEPRYVRAARLCLAQGRRGTARGFADRAGAVLDDLGLPRSAELESLVSALGG